MLTMGRPLKMGGNAWQYLTDSVAGAAELGADAAGYYAAKGTPPGRFLGRGLDGLGPGPGSVKPGDVVSPEMLHRMLAQLADPVTGQPARPSPLDRAEGAGGRLRPHISPAEIGVAHVGHGGPGHHGRHRGGHGQGASVRSSPGPRTTSSSPAPAPRAPARKASGEWSPARGCTTRAETAMPSSITTVSFGTEPRPSPTGCGAPWTARPCTPSWWPCPSATSAWSRTS